MRRDQPTTPFDVEADEMTQQFWGASKGWLSSEQPTVRRRAELPARTSDDTTGSLRVIRDGFAAFRPQTSSNATGEIVRQRRHGAPPRPEPQQAVSDRRREATLGELAAGRTQVDGWLDDDPFDDAPRHDHGHHDRTRATSITRRDRDQFDPEYHDPEYDVPLTPIQPLVERLGLGAVDPLLLRAGALVLALILLVPFAMSLRPDSDDSLPGDVVEAPQQVAAGAAPAASDAQPTALGSTVDTTAAAPATAQTEQQVNSTDVVAESADTVVAATASTQSTSAAAATDALDEADTAAMVDVVAERIVPVCPQTYTAASGDSWYRIADEAGVTPNELLAENNATAATVILPGDDICLPDGASMPTPPTTSAPADSSDPADEPSPSTTQAPTTTAPSTTVAPVASLSRTQVQELIRETWPEEEVETALAIARRESNFIATADNGSCCVGVFQIYWTVHRGWLDDFGITQRSDLFDARKNIAAAHHMWQQSGWGPWGG